MTKDIRTEKAPFQKGDIVQVENREGLHPAKYAIVSYAGDGFWQVRPCKKGALSLELPQSWLVLCVNRHMTSKGNEAMAAKMKNDRILLESAVAGWKHDSEGGLFSSPCWLAYHAGRYLAASHETRPVRCAKSRGYSVKIETEQGNRYLLTFTGKGLQHITARSL